MRKLILLSIIFTSPSLLASANVTTQGLVELKQDIKTLQKRVEGIEKKLATLDATGKTEEVPLNKPNVTNDELLYWVTDKIIEIYSYNYINFQQVMQNIRSYFTKDGYLSYVKALEDSKNLEIIKNKKMIVFGQVKDVAKIVQQGVESGIYRWEIAVPLVVQYNTDDKEIKQQIQVMIEVVRMPYTENKMGLAIHAITASLEKPLPKKENTTPSETPATKSNGIKNQLPAPIALPPAPSH